MIHEATRVEGDKIIPLHFCPQCHRRNLLPGRGINWAWFDCWGCGGIIWIESARKRLGPKLIAAELYRLEHEPKRSRLGMELGPGLLFMAVPGAQRTNRRAAA